MHAAIICGGPGAEHDVSVLTGLQAQRALSDSGAKADLLYWDKAGRWYLVEAQLEAKSFREGAPPGCPPLQLSLDPDRAGFLLERRLGRSSLLTFDGLIVCSHGSPGECGRLQSVLDLMGVPYGGPSMPGAALGMDKLAFAGLAKTMGVPSIRRLQLEASDELAESGPLVVKPRFGGSSIGVEVVEDLETARAIASTGPHYANGTVVEPFLDGWYDVNISVRRWPTFQTTRIERPIRSGSAILSYKDKYVPELGMNGAARELPAKLSPKVESDILRYSERLAEVTMVRGVARLDFMTDGRDVLVNEINTIPGSMARYLWDDVGVSFVTLLTDMIEESRSRPAYVASVAGADGSVLRSAGAIAAKLA